MTISHAYNIICTRQVQPECAGWRVGGKILWLFRGCRWSRVRAKRPQRGKRREVYNSRPLQCKMSRYDYDNKIITIIVRYRITRTRYSHLYGRPVGQSNTFDIVCIYNTLLSARVWPGRWWGNPPKKRFRDAFRLSGAPESRIVQLGLSRVVNIYILFNTYTMSRCMNTA